MRRLGRPGFVRRALPRILNLQNVKVKRESRIRRDESLRSQVKAAALKTATLH